MCERGSFSLYGTYWTQRFLSIEHGDFAAHLNEKSTGRESEVKRRELLPVLPSLYKSLHKNFHHPLKLRHSFSKQTYVLRNFPLKCQDRHETTYHYLTSMRPRQSCLGKRGRSRGNASPALRFNEAEAKLPRKTITRKMCSSRL